MALKDMMKSKMNEKSTDELLSIWTENDRTIYSAEAIEVITDILKGRGVDLDTKRQSEPKVDAADVAATEVVVTDIRIPFMSMVVLIIKWAIASIPALIILGFIAGALLKILGVNIGGPLDALNP